MSRGISQAPGSDAPTCPSFQKCPDARPVRSRGRARGSARSPQVTQPVGASGSADQVRLWHATGKRRIPDTRVRITRTFDRRPYLSDQALRDLVLARLEMDTPCCRIAAQGFRGIGPKAILDLTPGPGLTLVVGRNGSGKSSFAEGLELLLTGDTYRWSQRSKVWRDGWRNLHVQPPPGRPRRRVRPGGGEGRLHPGARMGGRGRPRRRPPPGPRSTASPAPAPRPSARRTGASRPSKPS
jgi:hypothetical protein